jgi:hypothetical protein
MVGSVEDGLFNEIIPTDPLWQEMLVQVATRTPPDGLSSTEYIDRKLTTRYSVICLDAVKADSCVVTLTCMHFFHDACFHQLCRGLKSMPFMPTNDIAPWRGTSKEALPGTLPSSPV